MNLKGFLFVRGGVVGLCCGALLERWKQVAIRSIRRTVHVPMLNYVSASGSHSFLTQPVPRLWACGICGAESCGPGPHVPSSHWRVYCDGQLNSILLHKVHYRISSNVVLVSCCVQTDINLHISFRGNVEQFGWSGEKNTQLNG